MYTLSINMWFQKLMKQFFFGIDQVVYNFISSIYDLLITIARTSVLSQADILDMADRVYKLLAVFMIFKVTFSLIMYVVNPDDFSDKNKGVGKLGTNIIISLSLLILTPYIFNYAYRLQTIILEDNSLATLIFGQDKDCGGEGQEKCETDFINSAGDKMAYITMSAFFTPNTSINELQSCVNILDGEKFNQDCSGLKGEAENYGPLGEKKGLYSLTFLSDSGTENPNFTFSTLQNYVAGVEHESLGLMFRQDLAVATDRKNEIFIMDYKYIFSTVVGVVIVLLLITFCMDVGLRSIKLAFLQLVAPIPIISYVDPKSGKDGLFKKWYQMCFKTYLSLFIRLLALYFAIYIISRVADMTLVDIVDGTTQTNAFVAIFIIVGALMFAKQLPEMLKGLGINLDGGGFTLNPLKKLEKDAIGGKSISKGVKLATRPVKGLATAGLVGGAALVTGQGLRGMGKAFGGAMKGEKFGKNFSGSYAAARGRKKQIEEMRANGVSPGAVRKENLYNRFHGMTRQQQQQQIDTRMDRVVKSWDDATGTVDAVDVEAKRLKAKVEGIKQAGASQFSDIRDSSGNVIKSASDQYQEAIKAAEGELDNRRNTVIADLSKLDDGNGGKAGGEAARAKIHQIIENRNKDIEVINGSNITYTDENGKQRTVKIDSSAPAKVVSKSTQGEQGAWKISDSYQDTESIAKFTEQKKS